MSCFCASRRRHPRCALVAGGQACALPSSEGIIWPKFELLMDTCGNDAPLMWMLHRRGYDVSSLRRLETETEKEHRIYIGRASCRERVCQYEYISVDAESLKQYISHSYIIYTQQISSITINTYHYTH